MSEEECIFCQIISKPAEKPDFIHEFPNSVALVNFEQEDYPGYALLLLKPHYDHVHDVPRDLMHAFIDERAQLADAIRKAYPDTSRMNYANLGNMVSHVHEHLIPRYPHDHNTGRPPWPMHMPPHLPPEDYKSIAAKIRTHLTIG